MLVTDKENGFCTSKVNERISGVRIAIFILCVLMAVSCIITMPDFIKKGETGTAVMSLLLAVIFLIPIYVIIRKVMLSKRAIEIAHRLESVMDSEITFERYMTIMGTPNAMKTLETLIKKDYLGNLVIDYEKSILDLLNVSSRMEAQGITTVYCPSCGAKNLAQPGRINYCEYCGGELIVK